ncbi:hypothetical protein GpartN1_g7377.t1 [Galdieria partita]|uniref:60S ribosome subunit biogenesis protein NIP7 homolog n=1 Tax=Galdieria partita TaxID=83374 RepID=A0A9C7Q5R8_9RHOD|nr:hypothetical protein GpartN1_g7377.t1 [Galdieria partita]
MRNLTEEELRAVFEKLAKFIGKDIKALVEEPNEGYCFRLQKDRVYYVREVVSAAATHIARHNLASLGLCVGKFTHGGRFQVHITFITYLARFAKYKVWLKSQSEMSFLYGNNVLKGGVARLTENTPKNQQVVVLNQNEIPLGFGVTARSSLELQQASSTDLIVLNQADIGSYLRDEDHFVGCGL